MARQKRFAGRLWASLQMAPEPQILIPARDRDDTQWVYSLRHGLTFLEQLRRLRQRYGPQRPTYILLYCQPQEVPGLAQLFQDWAAQDWAYGEPFVLWAGRQQPDSLEEGLRQMQAGRLSPAWARLPYRADQWGREYHLIFSPWELFGEQMETAPIAAQLLYEAIGRDFEYSPGYFGFSILQEELAGLPPVNDLELTEELQGVFRQAGRELIWPAAHQPRPSLPEEGYLIELDKNASYLAAARGLRCGWGQYQRFDPISIPRDGFIEAASQEEASPDCQPPYWMSGTLKWEWSETVLQARKIALPGLQTGAILRAEETHYALDAFADRLWSARSWLQEQAATRRCHRGAALVAEGILKRAAVQALGRLAMPGASIYRPDWWYSLCARGRLLILLNIDRFRPALRRIGARLVGVYVDALLIASPRPDLGELDLRQGQLGGYKIKGIWPLTAECRAVWADSPSLGAFLSWLHQQPGQETEKGGTQ